MTTQVSAVGREIRATEGTTGLFPRHAGCGRGRMRGSPGRPNIVHAPAPGGHRRDSYIGRLGVESLAAWRLVFPGDVDHDDVGRRHGTAGDIGDRTARSAPMMSIAPRRLPRHALLIGLCFRTTFMLGMLIVARTAGVSRGAAMCWLRQSPTYRYSSARRAAVADADHVGESAGTGNMKLPSLMMFSSAVCQIILGGTSPRLGPFPSSACARRCRFIDRLSHQRSRGWGVICFFRPGACRPQDQGTAAFKRAMFFDHSQGRRHRLLSPLQSY